MDQFFVANLFFLVSSEEKKKKFSSLVVEHETTRDIHQQQASEWMEAKQSIKCLEFLKYFGGIWTENIFIVFFYFFLSFKDLSTIIIFLWLDAAAAKYEFMMSLRVSYLIIFEIEIVDCCCCCCCCCFS